MADQLELINGDTLTGTQAGLKDGRLIWQSPVFGELTVPRAQIAKINGQPVSDGKSESPPETSAAGKERESSRFDFSGKIDLGFEKDEGSSKSEEYELGLRTSLSHGRYVHTLTLEHESEKKRDTNTEEDYELQYQADRFFRDVKQGFYVYGRTNWNKDRFRATDEWYALGSGAGYLWRAGSGTRIKLQGGLDYWVVSLQSDDRTAPGGRVLLDLRHRFERLANLVIFTEIQYLWEIGSRNNRVIETDSGLRVPLSERFFIELSLDHDRFETLDSPEFSQDNETEWNLKLGYKW